MAFDTDSRTAWISQGFERLVDRVIGAPAAVHFDVLIIGSGYGGAIAAATLAGRKKDGQPLRVAVLERGNEYLPGAFPTGLAELPAHVRRDGNRQGLFDVRFGARVTTVIANGLGGGSLINAGVMETPLPGCFQSGWPSDLSDLSTWKTFYDRAAEMVGARIDGAPNRIDDHPDGLPQKHKTLQSIAPDGRFRSADITVAMSDRTNVANVRLNKCLRCGDCATGCNFGAKESLDVGLLVQAHQAGAEIFSGGTVLFISQEGQNWIANAVFTDKNLRERQGSVTRIRAHRVIVAAGTLGSNEIMLRSHANGVPMSSSRLGKQCSTNGDMLASDFDTRDLVNNIADEAVRPSERHVGPTITGMIDLRKQKGVLIEEISVPASLRVAFTEVFGTVNGLQSLQKIDWSSHGPGFPSDDDYAVSPETIKNSAVFAIMGDDGAKGHIVLEDRSKDWKVDGTAYMGWDGPEPSTFNTGIYEITKLTRDTDGRLIANPAWRLLPDDMSFLTGGQKGPVTTVHPLGGLGMGDSGATGIVDPIGCVYKSDTTTETYDGLVVLDGSIVPTALGTNPALTIAALALRASEQLVSKWDLDAAAPAMAEAEPFLRPMFRDTDHAIEPQPTEVEVIERLAGPARFSPQGDQPADFVVELTLQFAPKAVRDLNPGVGGDCTLDVSSDVSNPLSRSEIRIFDKCEWDQLSKTWSSPAQRERDLDGLAKFRAPLTGKLKVLEQERSRFLGRTWRGFWAWLRNRGLRDIYQAFFASSGGSSGPGIWSRIKSGIAIASRAGEVRRLVYDLEIGQALPDASITLEGNRIYGVKRFTYNRRGNPWRQLMEVKLDTFPGLDTNTPTILRLDTAYLARIGVPLFQVTKQSDSVTAIADMLGFFGHFLRILLGIHIWSFRAPDERAPNEQIVFEPPNELQLSDGTAVSAEIVEEDGAIAPEKPAMTSSNEEVDGKVRITRYPNPDATNPPVVMFHGYSAGGTTFAHHAVTPNFASHLWESGREVLIADLRTSPYFGDTTAIKPWSFEQIAAQDVPYVIDKARSLTGAPKVDVVAHCMGTIVVSQAILMRPPNNGPENDLNKKIRRVAFTQVGPLVVFSPDNILRGYIMRYLIELLPENLLYQFRPQDPTLFDDLWDRVVATLPYPEEEFDIENPLWPCKRTPWVQTRHRMDALYGRDFSATRMGQGVLDHIDEHFGALNLRTVGSTLHYARDDMMTTYKGFNDFVSRDQLQKLRDIPIFSVHGADNGLADVKTVDRMDQIQRDAGLQYLKPEVIEGAGHQDCLIGADRVTTFEYVRAFFDADLDTNEGTRDTTRIARPPWIGPILTLEEPDGVLGPDPEEVNVVRIGSSPSFRKPEGAVFLRVHVSGNAILKPDLTDDWDKNYVMDSMVVYYSSALFDGWDAVELPAVDLMPNHDPDNPGNATLVLLIYDEAPGLSLVSEGSYVLMVNRALFSLNLLDRKRYPYRSDEITVESFDEMRDALFETLTGDVNAKGTGPFGNRAQTLRRRDIETERTAIDPNQPFGTRTVTESRMVFGPNEVFAEATAQTVNEHDYSLLDAVVLDPKVQETAQSATRFAFGSCQYPAGLLDKRVAYQSYQSLAQRLQASGSDAPYFVLFIGDQVYTDATAGLFDPRDIDDRYRTPYENWLRAPAVRTALRQATSYMLLDDHEIVDNWEPKEFPSQEDNDAFDEAIAGYAKYQHGLRETRRKFEFDKFPFFLLNTRSNRKQRKVNLLGTTELFDSDILDELIQWLDDHPGPKFIITPSLFLPRHRRAVQRDTRLSAENLSAIHSDGWDGYNVTMHAVLEHIANKPIKHVVFLSGDEHRASLTTADIRDQNGDPVTRLTSIHTAAMWAPFPFANGKAEDIMDNEEFEFAVGGNEFTCNVTTERPADGDGPTYIKVDAQGPDWRLECEFADGSKPTIIL